MDYQGKRAAFYTLGCKLNFSETSAIAHSLEEVGFQRVDFEEQADVYVVNTCTVTNAGDKSSRNIIRRAIRQNPEALIVVVGCYAQLSPEDIGHIEGVDLILGTQEKFHLPAWLGDLKKRPVTEIHTTRLKDMRQYHRSYSWGDRTRCFLKVQDGCDYYCTYCVIPYARGRSRNDTIANTTATARLAIEKGYREIILTGVNIGDFGKSSGESFIDLVRELEKTPGLVRLRLGSIEPNLLTNELVELVAASQVVMPHFHIPLQSGSDRVLELMGRRYLTALFEDRVNYLRALMPHAFIGVDIIAGTNGETDEFFEESYSFVNRLDISQLHAFPYSERAGTQALKIAHTVAPEERKLRTRKYINLSEKKLRAFYQRHCGTTQSVLFEERVPDGLMEGFTTNYIRVAAPFRERLLNLPVNVKLGSILPDGKVAVTLLP